jgi:uncharacterized protein (TIGR03435 family)
MRRMRRTSTARGSMVAIAIFLSLTTSSRESGAQVLAQSPAADAGAPSFEAISVKESSGTRIPVQWQGPRFVAGAVPLQTLLVAAYDVPIYQLAELPEWVRTTRYEISAVASRAPTQAEQWPWLRALLARRFGVVARTETQERPMYALVLARSDGRLGPGLRPSSNDCIAIVSARASAPAVPSSGPACGIAISAGGYKRDGIPLSLLADTLSTRLQRAVVDRTGLTGFFDVDLHFRPLGNSPAVAGGAEEPDLITALADQLGLKVESTRGPVQVTVFDRLERPTPD